MKYEETRKELRRWCDQREVELQKDIAALKKRNREVTRWLYKKALNKERNGNK